MTVLVIGQKSGITERFNLAFAANVKCQDEISVFEKNTA